MKLNDPRYKDSMVSIPSPQIFLEGQHQQRFHYIQFFQLPLARGSHISSLVVALKVNMKGSLFDSFDRYNYRYELHERQSLDLIKSGNIPFDQSVKLSCPIS